MSTTVRSALALACLVSANVPAQLVLMDILPTKVQRYATKVKDINPTGDAKIALMTPCNGKVIFYADDGVHGTEPWVSDGTSSGTFMLKDINQGTENTNLHPFMVFNNKAYFKAFHCLPPICGYHLWVTDGTAAGTRILKENINVSMWYAAIYNGKLYFQGNGEPWVTDGTTAGTVLLKDLNLNESEASSFGVANGKLFFSASNNTNGEELWVSDGTAIGTTMLSDINPGSASSFPGVKFTTGSRVLFTSTLIPTPNFNDWRIYVSGGVAGSTQQVGPANLRYTGEGYHGMSHACSFGDKVYFMAHDASEYIETQNADPSRPPIKSYKHNLWVSDGTTKGTQRLTSYSYTSNAEAAYSFQPHAGKLYFISEPTETSGPKLYSTDGTVAGTKPMPGYPGESGATAACSILGTGNNKLYFITSKWNVTVADITAKLWAVNNSIGTANGQVLEVLPPLMVKGATVPKDPFGPYPFGAAIGSAFLFNADYDNKGRELWKVTW